MNPILKMALRRAKPGTGSSNEFLDRRTAMQTEMIEDYDARSSLRTSSLGRLPVDGALHDHQNPPPDPRRPEQCQP